jgi:type VI secretion system (T6SS) effector TldE1-like protein
MSTGSVALAGKVRRASSGKAISYKLLSGAAVVCLVVGCGYVVHTNIIGASVYPTLGDAGYDEPVMRRPKLAARSATQAVSEAFAALPDTSVIEKPAQLAAISPSMFNERFAAAAAQGVASRAAEAPSAPGLDAPKVADAPKPADAPKLAEAPKSKAAAPAQLALNTPSRIASPPAEAKPDKPAGLSVREMAQRAKAAVMSIASNEKFSITEKLWGKDQSSPHTSLLSYASADASITGSIGRDQNPLHGGQAPYDRDTAVYDISAHTVYLPDGTRLEAHSGLGSKLDDPKSAPIKMHGVTPPHIYELKPREALFHGVPALRLTPIGGEDAIYGRAGLLAHTYMLGPNGDSNGCVSFRDYNAFLNAYRNQGIKKLAVVARVE